jgi:hypothetical protein
MAWKAFVDEKRLKIARHRAPNAPVSFAAKEARAVSKRHARGLLALRFVLFHAFVW